jgi:hypothetical protein
VSRHLDEAVTFELAQVVAQLVEAVGGLGEIKGGEDGMVDLPPVQPRVLLATAIPNPSTSGRPRLPMSSHRHPEISNIFASFSERLDAALALREKLENFQPRAIAEGLCPFGKTVEQGALRTAT